MRLRAEKSNFLRGIVVAHSFDVVHLTLIIDALKFHDASLSDLTVSGDTLETDRFGKFAKTLKISFVAGGGDRTASVNNDGKGSRKKVAHSINAGVGLFHQGWHVRSVDESGLIDDVTHVLERKQGVAKAIFAGRRNAGKGIDSSESSNQNKMTQLLLLGECGFTRLRRCARQGGRCKRNDFSFQNRLHSKVGFDCVVEKVDRVETKTVTARPNGEVQKPRAVKHQHKRSEKHDC